MAEPPPEQPKQRRFIKRLLTAVCGVVIALGSYVGAYCSFGWLQGRRVYVETPTTETVHRVVFAPLFWYQESKCPGAVTLATAEEWCYWRGKGQPRSWGRVAASVRNREPFKVGNSAFSKVFDSDLAPPTDAASNE